MVHDYESFPEFVRMFTIVYKYGLLGTFIVHIIVLSQFFERAIGISVITTIMVMMLSVLAIYVSILSFTISLFILNIFGVLISGSILQYKIDRNKSNYQNLGLIGIWYGLFIGRRSQQICNVFINKLE